MPLPKKIGPLDARVAIGLALVVFVGVFLYVRNRNAAAVPVATGSTAAAPAATDNSGAQAAPAAPDLSALLNALYQPQQPGAAASAYSTAPSSGTAPFDGTTASMSAYTGASPPVQAGAVNAPTLTPVQQAQFAANPNEFRASIDNPFVRTPDRYLPASTPAPAPSKPAVAPSTTVSASRGVVSGPVAQ